MDEALEDVRPLENLPENLQPLATQAPELSSPLSLLAMPAAMPADAADRKSFLAGLVARLSLGEIWMLQVRLAGLDLRTDVFGRLPPELQIIVADQLGPADLGCCLDVSPAWRRAFLHESVRRGQARRCFPGLLEYASAVEHTDDAGPEQVDRAFADTARKYAARARGRFRAAFRHLPQPTAAVLAEKEAEKDKSDAGQRTWSWRQQKTQQEEKQPTGLLAETHAHPHPYPHSQPQPQPRPRQYDEAFDGPEYAHGRLFWQLYHSNTTHVLVDDLHSGRRLHFSVRDDILRGERFMMSSFGDEMVVMAFTGTRLLAWNFITGEQHIKQMPAQIDMAATLGRRVCIQSQGNIYEWQVGGGGKMLEVDVTGLDARHQLPDLDGRLPSFFLLDPVRTDVFFRGNFVLETAESNGFATEPTASSTSTSTFASASVSASAPAPVPAPPTSASSPTSSVSAGTGTLCFFVHEFRGRRYRQTFVYRLPFDSYAFPSSLVETTVRRDGRGSYALASWRVMSAPALAAAAPASASASISSSGLPQLHHQPSWGATSVSVRGVGSLSFNIYTRTFARSFFRLPPLAPSLGRDRPTALRVHVWNDQLLTLIDRHRDAHSGGRMRKADPMLLAFDDAHSEAAACSPPLPFSAVPVYVAAEGSFTSSSHGSRPEARRLAHFHPDEHPSRSTGGGGGSWRVDDADWAKNGCLLRYILDLDTQPAAPDKPAHIGDYHIMGDDDFLVAVHDNEHTVWSFCAGFDDDDDDDGGGVDDENNNNEDSSARLAGQLRNQNCETA